MAHNETGGACTGRVSGIQTGLCWPAQKGGREPTPDSKLSPWTTAVRSQQWSGHGEERSFPKAQQRGETFKCSKACSHFTGLQKPRLGCSRQLEANSYRSKLKQLQGGGQQSATAAYTRPSC